MINSQKGLAQSSSFMSKCYYTAFPLCIASKHSLLIRSCAEILKNVELYVCIDIDVPGNLTSS